MPSAARSATAAESTFGGGLLARSIAPITAFAIATSGALRPRLPGELEQHAGARVARRAVEGVPEAGDALAAPRALLHHALGLLGRAHLGEERLDAVGGRAVERARERREPGLHHGVDVGVRRGGDARGEGRGVELVVGEQDQQRVDRRERAPAPASSAKARATTSAMRGACAARRARAGARGSASARGEQADQPARARQHGLGRRVEAAARRAPRARRPAPGTPPRGGASDGQERQHALELGQSPAPPSAARPVGQRARPEQLGHRLERRAAPREVGGEAAAVGRARPASSR